MLQHDQGVRYFGLASVLCLIGVGCESSDPNNRSGDVDPMDLILDASYFANFNANVASLTFAPKARTRVSSGSPFFGGRDSGFVQISNPDRLAVTINNGQVVEPVIDGPTLTYTFGIAPTSFEISLSRNGSDIYRAVIERITEDIAVLSTDALVYDLGDTVTVQLVSPSFRDALPGRFSFSGVSTVCSDALGIAHDVPGRAGFVLDDGPGSSISLGAEEFLRTDVAAQVADGVFESCDVTIAPGFLGELGLFADRSNSYFLFPTTFTSNAGESLLINVSGGSISFRIDG